MADESLGTTITHTTTPATADDDYDTTTKFAGNSIMFEPTSHIIIAVMGLVGLICFVFNAIMVALYYKYSKLQKHITFLMLMLFKFCMIQGIVTSVVFVLHRELIHLEPSWWCVTSSLLIEFLDEYILLLLPMLAIERYVTIKYPLVSLKRVQKLSRIAIVITVCIALLCLLPMAPFLNVSQSLEIHVDNDPVLKYQRLVKIDANTCHGVLNVYNVASPVITITLEAVCVFTVVAVYIKMYFIVKERVDKFSSMTHSRQEKLKKAAISVMIVAIIFLVTILPYGLTLQLKNFCSSGHFEIETCYRMSNNLKNSFYILAHVANFVAPLMFTLFSPNIRKVLFAALRCRHPYRDAYLKSHVSSETYAKGSQYQQEIVEGLSYESADVSPSGQKQFVPRFPNIESNVMAGLSLSDTSSVSSDKTSGETNATEGSTSIDLISTDSSSNEKLESVAGSE